MKCRLWSGAIFPVSHSNYDSLAKGTSKEQSFYLLLGMECEKLPHLQLIVNQKHHHVFLNEDHILILLHSICWPNYPMPVSPLILPKLNMIMAGPKFKCA